MPTLIFTDSDGPRGGVLNSRVLIGRRLKYGVMLEDASVARLHAWIDPIADENTPWVLNDAGSKAGTYVNEERIIRHPLRDGDNIRVGNTSLVYHDRDELPGNMTSVELTPPPAGVDRGAGILFECACGAPLWVGNDLAGKRGVCRHCRQPVTAPPLVMETDLPHAPIPATPAPVPPAPPPELVASSISGKRGSKCGICHAAVLDTDASHQCTDCAMTFHEGCWRENHGCSSYGCPQVNILQPTGAAATSASPQNVTEETSATEIPWEKLLLSASVVCSALGCLLFGVLPAVVAAVTLGVLYKQKAKRPLMLVICLIVCLVGIAGGLGLSDFFWFNGRHLPAVLRHL